MRSAGALSVALALSLRQCLAQVCPNGIVEVDVQTIAYVIQHPYLITGYVPVNTVITVGGGLPVQITNAPLVVSTQVTSNEFSTRTATSIRAGGVRGPNNSLPTSGASSTGGEIRGPNNNQPTTTRASNGASTRAVDGPNNSVSTVRQSGVLPGFVTTTVAGGSGATRTTITVFPSGTKSGTIIVVTPGPINGPQQTNGGTNGANDPGSLTTITEAGAAGATVTIQAGGTDTQGTVVVVTTAQPVPFDGPYTTITVAGPPGSEPTTFTLPPANGGSTGTVIVQTPGPTAFTGPYTTITQGYDGPVTVTITVPPGAGGTQGTVIVETPIVNTNANTNGPNEPPVDTTTATSATSSTSTSTSTTTTGPPVDTNNPDPNNPPDACTPDAGAGGAPFCTVSLPPACARLGQLGVVVTALDLASCTLALGGRAVGDVATCLASTQLAGPSIVSCLTTYLVGTPCITNLPSPCLKLVVDAVAGSALNAGVRLCSNALGPYSGGAAAQACLDTTVNFVGANIVSCLQTAFGFPVVAPTLPEGCPGAPVPQQACPITSSILPGACTQLVNFNGLALVVQTPLCLLSLGDVGAIPQIATCLTTQGITVLTQGSSIVSCLNTALEQIGEGACITRLPDVCARLSGLVGINAALQAQVSLCTAALRVYSVNSAIAACLSNTASGGASMVDCLNFRLFGIGTDPLVTLTRRRGVMRWKWW